VLAAWTDALAETAVSDVRAETAINSWLTRGAKFSAAQSMPADREKPAPTEVSLEKPALLGSLDEEVAAEAHIENLAREADASDSAARHFDGVLPERPVQKEKAVDEDRKGGGGMDSLLEAGDPADISDQTCTGTEANSDPISNPAASELPAVEKEVDLTVVKDLMSSMVEDSEEGMRFSMWDCGGQAGFDDTHSLFLTRWSIYLLTVDMRSLLNSAPAEERLEALENIRFWLNSIAVHAVDPSDNSLAPIIIVGTHKDKVSEPKEHEEISKMLYERFSHCSAWNRGVISFKNGTVSTGRGRLWIFPVDNTRGISDPVISELRLVIQHTVQREKFVNHKVPFEWLRVLKHLQLQSEAGSCYTTLQHVRAVCGDSGMPSLPEIALEDELSAMLKFFHEFGYVMHHSEPDLRDVIVLDPVEFLVKPMARVMSKLDIHDDPWIETARKHGGTHFARFRNGGLLHRRLLDYFWSDCLDKQSQLEALAVKYGLFIPLLTDEDHEKAQHELQYIVPAQLKKAPSTRDICDDQGQAYLCFAPSDVMDEWRGKKKGYVSAQDAKRDGFLPRSLFANAASHVVAHAQCLFNMSYDDIDLSSAEMSLAFGKHRFCLRELVDDNMIQLLIQVASHRTTPSHHTLSRNHANCFAQVPGPTELAYVSLWFSGRDGSSDSRYGATFDWQDGMQYDARSQIRSARADGRRQACQRPGRGGRAAGPEGQPRHSGRSRRATAATGDPSGYPYRSRQAAFIRRGTEVVRAVAHSPGVPARL